MDAPLYYPGLGYTYSLSPTATAVVIEVRPILPLRPPRRFVIPYTKTIFEHKPRGGGHYIWDVDAATELCKGLEPIECRMPEWSLAQIEQQYEGGMDMATAETADLSRPVIFVEWPDGGHSLIDGWHRFHKAAALGKTHITGYVIPHAQARTCLVAELPPGCPTLEEAKARLLAQMGHRVLT